MQLIRQSTLFRRGKIELSKEEYVIYKLGRSYGFVDGMILGIILSIIVLVLTRILGL